MNQGDGGGGRAWRGVCRFFSLAHLLGKRRSTTAVLCCCVYNMPDERGYNLIVHKPPAHKQVQIYLGEIGAYT